MKSGLSARLPGLEMTGRRFRWEPGIYVRSIQGIDGGGEVSSQTVPRGFGVGAYDLDNTRDTARTIAVVAFAYERSEWALQQRKDQISRVLAEEDASGWFVWQKDGATRRALVRRDRFSEPVRRRGGDPIVDFTIGLRAPDQRIYGEQVTTGWGSAVTVENRGGYPAPVVIEVRGSSVSGYTITGPRSKIVQVSAAITSGVEHSYDADAGLLSIGGVPQLLGVNRSDRLEIPYGRHQITVDNGCELRARYADTWAP